MYGKAIELFLVNGTPDSLITAELSNWNGKALKIPRNEVQSCDREDIRAAGVYFLFCQENGEDSVYIGEAENAYERLCQHLRDYQTGKEQYYWTTAVIFVGRDLNKAHTRYLENRFVMTAKQYNRVLVLTKNTYKTSLKESQVATMEEFISNTCILLGALGYKILEPMPTAKADTLYFYCQGNGASGMGFLSNGGFTVIKGSTVSDHTAPSFEVHGLGYFKLRQHLENDGTITNRVFQSDMEFSSPSAASAVIMGHTTNGNIEWKTKDGTKLKDV